jgi:magnesium chelatase subunit I
MASTPDYARKPSATPPQIHTLGELRASGYVPRSIKEEMRVNLIDKLKKREPVFTGIFGYDETVLPDLERAILSRHNMLLLGLRGQAKTRLARLMIGLLDEWIPVVEGSEINDDPMQPLSRFAKDLIKEHGDYTPVTWLHRDERYNEKLATPDVTVADLIGDSDPIKAANLRLPYSDERVIHFGLIPRSHRCLFVINELPDLQPRIQVALFNILQEGDIQIRGFKLRLPLDIEFVFTANPEDYTNRGSIVTPLKDRIESQILTHYPKSRQDSLAITEQEADIAEGQSSIVVPQLLKLLVEQIAIEARTSDYVDPKSGVSARMTISAYELLLSAAERRLLLNPEKHPTARISDLIQTVPAITGKVELVYEGEQEGPAIVARTLVKKAMRTLFSEMFPDPEKLKKKKQESPYKTTLDWFGDGNAVDIENDATDQEYRAALDGVPGLKELIKDKVAGIDLKSGEGYVYREFVLHGLAEYSQLSKSVLETKTSFKDLLGSMFSFSEE